VRQVRPVVAATRFLTGCVRVGVAVDFASLTEVTLGGHTLGGHHAVRTSHPALLEPYSSLLSALLTAAPTECATAALTVLQGRLATRGPQDAAHQVQRLLDHTTPSKVLQILIELNGTN
jgi:hypothetical protein